MAWGEATPRRRPTPRGLLELLREVVNLPGVVAGELAELAGVRSALHQAGWLSGRGADVDVEELATAWRRALRDLEHRRR